MKNESRVLWGFGVFVMSLVCLVSSAIAGTLGENITMNGFGHQSGLKSAANNYVAHNSTDGSFDDYVVGLTFSAEVNDRVSVRTQVLSSPLGFYVDWGFAEYSVNESIGFKFGKVKLPLGLYTEIADVKSLQPFSYLPSLIYSHGMTSYNGVGFSGSMDFLNNWGSELEVFGGGSQARGAHHPEPLPMNNFVGGRLTINTPLTGARFMLSAMRSDLEMGSGSTSEMIVESKAYIASGEFIGDRFFVRGEAAKFQEMEDAISWYSEAGFLIGEYIQPVVRYIHQRNENTPSLTLAARNLIGQTDSQNEIGIGINVFMTNAVVLKVEQHFINGSSQLNLDEYEGDGLDNSWSLTAASVAFAF